MSGLSGDKTLAARFWAKVDKRGPDECWQWKAYTAKGYGRIGVDGKPAQAHRVSYELVVGPIPEGMQVDHLCRNRGCVNPAHLEPVTPSENTQRGLLPKVAGAHNRAKTHCPQGHEYSPENTYVDRDGGRHCRNCINKRTRIARRKQRERSKA